MELFLNFYTEQTKKLEFKPKSAIEFRHTSWSDEKVFAILKKFKIAMVITSSPKISEEIFTTNFTYIRMHGNAEHNSDYKNKELIELKKKIDAYPEKIKNIFIYFNNDYSAYAIDNAKFLIKLFEKS